MTDPFESPKELVGRARDHTDELEAAIKGFFDRRPYARVVEFDAETGQDVHKIRLTAKLPGKLRAIVKDATSNLRDALDHAVYGAAIAFGVALPEKTGFPFANDAVHLEGELRSWKFTDVPAEIHPLLASFKPYPAGNDVLISLNRKRNPNTHRMLVPVGFAALGASIGISSMQITGGAQIGYSRWDPAKNEVEFMRLGRGSQADYDVKVAFEVTFGEVEIVSGKPVLSTLREIAAEVERIVSAIEAETARILRERSP